MAESKAAKDREFREDAEGVQRLVAAPGDPVPGKDDVVPGPIRVQDGATHWDPESDVELAAGVKSAIPADQRD
jgi:hypothetical protein